MNLQETTQYFDARYKLKEEPSQPRDPHREISQGLPTGINFARCKNNECGTVVKNANSFTSKYRSCPECKFNGIPENTVHKNALCPTCGKVHEREDLEDSDIELEDGR